MATTTEKYGLTLPAGSDYVDIEVLNENTRKIDAALAGKSDGVTLTHEKSGTVHALTGLGERSGILQAVFKAAAGFAGGDTFTVDGAEYIAQQMNGEALSDGFFASGAAVSCVVDTEGLTMVFSGGSSLPYTYGTTDLTAGTSPLADGAIHLVYE